MNHWIVFFSHLMYEWCEFQLFDANKMRFTLGLHVSIVWCKQIGPLWACKLPARFGFCNTMDLSCCWRTDRNKTLNNWISSKVSPQNEVLYLIIMSCFNSKTITIRRNVPTIWGWLYWSFASIALWIRQYS